MSRQLSLQMISWCSHRRRRCFRQTAQPTVTILTI